MLRRLELINGTKINQFFNTYNYKIISDSPFIFNQKPKTMKTIKFSSNLYLSILAGILLLSSCSKEESDPVSSSLQSEERTAAFSPDPIAPVYSDWLDNFTSASSLDSRWLFYGASKPKWVDNACGRWGLFDNNGVEPLGSTAISKTKVGSMQGYIIESEVYIDVQNPKGIAICPEIGITRYENILNDPELAEAGISMKLVYIGKGSPVVPANKQNQIYVQASSLSIDGTFENSGNFNLNAENISSAQWHKMKIVIGSDQKVAFYLDDQLVFAPSRKVHPSLMKNKKVLLGFLSSGSAGKAYHDWVKVSYPLPR